ncbi:glycosyl hydrolase family 8 [Falsiroseomonas sp. CW058]|uniref:glycosyl hydrolase family 8 n=1 Tax=Falsiroseomonas sp. CW058 TaxID=3388664 RepID=UPI003D318C3C
MLAECIAAPMIDANAEEIRAPSALRRRGLLALSTAALVATPACGAASTTGAEATGPDNPAAQWAAFRDRYVTPEGRVLDTGNQGISHSEGQGYAMLFAEAFDDRPTFERVFHWARRNLRRPDGLHSWRFRPGSRNPVEDPNNATDGDLYIAWSLLRAADRWGEPEWRREGTRIGEAILQKLVLEVGGRTVLLPGAQGFVHPDRVVVNPSYYAFPALFALSRAVPDRAWQRVMGDGVTMLRNMRYGRWGLPADWVEMGRTHATAALVRPAAGWPMRFSFDAVRVPLHLAWAGMTDEPAMRAAANFWNDPSLPMRPAWADLRSGQVAPYSAPAGIEAVAEVTTATGWQRGLARNLPSVARSPDYYSAALALLSRIALRENPRNLLADATPPAPPPPPANTAVAAFRRLWARA